MIICFSFNKCSSLTEISTQMVLIHIIHHFSASPDNTRVSRRPVGYGSHLANERLPGPLTIRSSTSEQDTENQSFILQNEWPNITPCHLMPLIQTCSQLTVCLMSVSGEGFPRFLEGDKQETPFNSFRAWLRPPTRDRIHVDFCNRYLWMLTHCYGLMSQGNFEIKIQF